LKIDVEEVCIGMDEAIPCGLIINELVSNSLKHAFPDRRKGEISICLLSTGDGGAELEVRDDGVGLPEGVGIDGTETLGLRLVDILTQEQLNGSLEMEGGKGTMFKIKFGGR
ncbi:MAG: sensor histidine kinase, partial [Thermoplasmata archaeon]|nr:sensor histidine kinase [Thermoplasmata archaeon]